MSWSIPSAWDCVSLDAVKSTVTYFAACSIIRQEVFSGGSLWHICVYRALAQSRWNINGSIMSVRSDFLRRQHIWASVTHSWKIIFKLKIYRKGVLKSSCSILKYRYYLLLNLCFLVLRWSFTLTFLIFTLKRHEEMPRILMSFLYIYLPKNYQLLQMESHGKGKEITGLNIRTKMVLHCD